MKSGRTPGQQRPEQARTAEHESPLPRRYGSTAYHHRDAGDEGANGDYDERPQGVSVQ